MALGNLQSAIEKLRKTIEAHRGYLAENETRTRQVLIDPLLRKLGWDVSNPNIVQLEYRVKQGRPDYALMSKGKPLAVVEAKRLGSDLGDDQIMQALAYANAGGIPYMIITNGDTWEMYEVFKPAELEDRLLIKLELFQQPTDKNASQAWAMRKPNLTAKKPVFDPPRSLFRRQRRRSYQSKEPVFKPPKPAPDKPSGQLPSGGSSTGSDNWCSFEWELYPPGTKPAKLKIVDSPEETVKDWKNAIHKVAAWLADEGILSANDCPIGGRAYTFIGLEMVNPNGTPFRNPQPLSNGLILQGDYVNTREQWRKLKQFLKQPEKQSEVDSSTIRVSYR